MSHIFAFALLDKGRRVPHELGVSIDWGGSRLVLCILETMSQMVYYFVASTRSRREKTSITVVDIVRVPAMRADTASRERRTRFHTSYECGGGNG